MNKKYFIGEDSLRKYTEKSIKNTLLMFPFKKFSVPRELFSANQIFIQMELTERIDLFFNIRYTLPLLIMFQEYLIKPIILIGFFPSNFYEEKYNLPLNSNPILHYEQIPFKHQLKKLYLSSSTCGSQSFKKIDWESYFNNSEVNILNQLDHDLGEHSENFTTLTIIKLNLLEINSIKVKNYLQFDKRPIVEFMLIDDQVDWSKKFLQSFDSVKRDFEKFYNIFSIYIRSVHDNLKAQIKDNKILNPSECALNFIEDSDFSGNCQGILLDWELDIKLQKFPLIRRIKRIRPELPIFIITQNRNGYEIVEQSNGLIDDFFLKPEIESDIVNMMKRLLAHFEIRRQSPFWSAYKEYIFKSNDTWHTPGHFGGSSLRTSKYVYDFYEYFGDNTFKGDLSVSVDILGSLLDNTAYIELAQKKAAKTFGAKHTFFVTNGSSTANKVTIQSIVRPGDSVILDRNCHKSIHYAIVQNYIKPFYLESEYNKELGIFAPPKLADIEKITSSRSHNFKLLILTGCTYEGILSDIKPIVDICHAKDIKVMIDEAWFAYSRFHPEYFEYSALNSGADYVTHSSHKVLSAFSQASMIHVNDPDFDEQFFQEIYNIYTSTSPQYQIIGSLDIATTQMRMEGFKMISESLRIANGFRKKIKSKLNYIRVIEDDEIDEAFPHLKKENSKMDKLKVLIDFSSTGLSAKKILDEIREKAMLEIEKSTHSTFLLLFTIGTKEEKANRLYMVLKDIDDHVSKRNEMKVIRMPDLPIGIELKPGTTPSEVFFGKRKKIHFLDSIDQISAGMITPYPPGIPLLVPSQIIKNQHIEFLKFLISMDSKVHGVFNEYIYVKDE